MKYRDFNGVCGEEDANFPMNDYREYFREVESTRKNFITASVPDPMRGGLRTVGTKLWVPSPDGEHPLRHLFANEIMAGVPWAIGSRWYRDEIQDDTRRLSSRSRPYSTFAIERQRVYRRDLRAGEALPIQVFCTDCPKDPDLKYPRGHWISGYNRAESIMDGRGYLFAAGMCLEFRGLTLAQHNLIDFRTNTEHGFPLAPMDRFLMVLNFMEDGMSNAEAFAEFGTGESRNQFDDGVLGALLFFAHGKDEDLLTRIDKNGERRGKARSPQELGRNVRVFGRTSVPAFVDRGIAESKRRWMLFLNDKTGIAGGLGGGRTYVGNNLETLLGYNPNQKMTGLKVPEDKWAAYEGMRSDLDAVESMRNQLARNRKALKESKITADEELAEAVLACAQYINMVGTQQLRKVRAAQSTEEKESLVRSAFILSDVYGDLMAEEEEATA